MGSYGQDWASFQPDQPDASGLDFAFVKITEGLTYTNPRWVSQRADARAAGLVWGGYHYPHMGNDPVAEADRFLGMVAWQPGDLVVLDWEGYDSANRAVPRADQVAYKDAWLDYVKGQLPDHQVGTYMNVDYWENVDNTGRYGDFLWIATAGRSAGNPGIRAPWMFHQYTDQPVDSDFCHLDGPALRAWSLALTAPPAPAQGPQPPAPARRRPRAYHYLGV